MKSLIVMSLIVTLVSGTVFAKVQGGGGGRGARNLGPATTGVMPPGLQHNGMPHGLNKQNKTPYGWSQGQKKGWGQKSSLRNGQLKHKNVLKKNSSKSMRVNRFDY